LRGVLADKYYMGAVVGRYANRIANGEFTIKDKKYKLAKNDGKNHLHGGIKGFDKVIYSDELTDEGPGHSLKLSYSSKDAEEGYPGNLKFTVSYSLTDKNELSIEYSATTDKPTVINVTNHMYFNLTGDFDREILSHELAINADEFTPINAGLIPTGKLLPVKGTPLDFKIPTVIGDRINEDFEQLKFASGYDHNYVLTKKTQFDIAAEVYEPESGRILEIFTTEPGVQFYSGNFLDGALAGKGGKPIKYRSGFCLEPQHFPDSPNQPGFPSTELKPGDEFHSMTVYKFTVT
jgi:aldose 1-epimerase